MPQLLGRTTGKSTEGFTECRDLGLRVDARYHDEIERRQFGPNPAKRLANSTLPTIPNHRVADLP
jgi:hypothetical protein